MIVNEIRINQEFTQLTESVYEKDLKSKSSPRVRKHHTDTKHYLKKISSRFNQTNFLMPPNCRYIERFGNGGHLVVVEEPSALRTIKTEWGGLQSEFERLEKKGKTKEWEIDKKIYFGPGVRYPYRFHLAFPYVIFIKAFDEFNNLLAGQVYLRIARLTGLSDYLMRMPLMNISDTQYICYGDRAASNRSLDAALADIIMKFWSGSFNGDYTYNHFAYKNVPYVNTHIEWQYHSQTDPMFIYNVDWIRMPYNLGEAISRFKCDHKLITSTNLAYTELSKIFAQPMDTGKKEKISGLRKAKYQNLFYDVAQGMYLDDQFFIHVGDSIKLKNGKMAYVDSFISFSGSSDIKYIQFKTETGINLLLKYTPESKAAAYLLAAFKKERYAESGTLANGVVIKEGNIVIVDTPGTSSRQLYKHVNYIRKTRDGITEAKLGNDFYILENLKGKLFNVDKPEFDGIKLKKNTDYILMTTTTKVARHRGYKVKYDGLDVDINGSLAFSFKDVYRKAGPIKIKYDPVGKTPTSMYRLFEMDSVRSMAPIFRIGRSLVTARQEGDSSAICKTGYAWGTPEGIITEYNARMRKVHIDQIVKHCLFDNGSRFRIESFDLDVEFTIGDKVVVADWENPINTLIVKTIQGFKVDKDYGTLDFILADKNDNLTTVKYIDTGDSSNVMIGKIRKIVNKFGKLSAGIKIIANESSISNFPKKDINIIIGFITDTGGEEPLVLCSNGCTLWYSDVIDNFKKVTMKSRNWKKLAHAPIDVQKIKFQPGDIIMSNGDYKTRSGWLVWTSGVGMHKVSNCVNLHKYPDHYHLDGYIKSQSFLDCIPNPRMPAKAISDVGIVKGWPNFHGLFTSTNLVEFSFIKDERSILYVSDPRK